MRERHRSASWRKAIPFEGEIEQIRSHHTDVVKVPRRRRVAHAVLAPHRDRVANVPVPVWRPEELVGGPDYVLCANPGHTSLLPTGPLSRALIYTSQQ